MKRTTLTAALAAVMVSTLAPEESRFARYNRPAPRPCLNCGKPHNHNNSFCSPECCTYYRDQSNQGES